MSESEPVSEVPEETPVESGPNDVVYRVMSAESVTYELSDASPQVHLMEAESPFRNISVPIALPEAYALHNALQGVAGRRPGTHELASAIVSRLQADIIAARIIRYADGVFYAELDLMTTRGREKFDCRTSDAIILALRQGVPAPILCAEEVLAVFYS
jgi:bifunctional DNase/RNase